MRTNTAKVNLVEVISGTREKVERALSFNASYMYDPTNAAHIRLVRQQIRIQTDQVFFALEGAVDPSVLYGVRYPHDIEAVRLKLKHIVMDALLATFGIID